MNGFVPHPHVAVLAAFAKVARAERIDPGFLKQIENMADPICGYAKFDRDFRAELGLPALDANATPIENGNWWVSLGEFATQEPIGTINTDRVFHYHYSHLRRARKSRP